jgi:hypothetical protein
MVDFTLENAIKVAEYDYNYGVVFAIDILEEYGFDCSYYWNIVNEIVEDNQEFNERNIQARDNQYKILGIKDLMDKAYDIVWGRDWDYE